MSIRKTPTLKIHLKNSHPSNSPLENISLKIPTQKISTQNIPIHVFKYFQPGFFLIFCFFIIVTVIIDIT